MILQPKRERVINARSVFCAALAVLALTGCEAANDVGKGVQDERAKAEPNAAAPLNPAQTAYAAANARMHGDMGAAIDADADVAFMQGMIPHHQGAVDMAKIVLEHGKDPATRAMADAIIKTQTAEIKAMEAWLAARSAKPAMAGPDTPVANEAVDHKAMGH